MEWSLTSNSGQNWLKVSEIRFNGQGTVLPRLSLNFDMRKEYPNSQVRIVNLSAQLKVGNELLSLSPPFLGPREVHNATYITFEFPLSAVALAKIDEQSRLPTISLIVSVTGALKVLPEPGQRQFASELEPGQWADVELRETAVGLNMAVSDWYNQVLQPIGTYRYAMYAVALPKVQEAGSFANAVRLLLKADEAYARGDDVSVFANCKGAWEALPGAPKAIFEQIIEEAKKKSALDQVALQTVNYINHGRHVAGSGDEAGDFPIDHRDAELALNLSKLLVGHVSRLSL